MCICTVVLEDPMSFNADKTDNLYEKAKTNDETCG